MRLSILKHYLAKSDIISKKISTYSIEIKCLKSKGYTVEVLDKSAVILMKCRYKCIYVS